MILVVKIVNKIRAQALQRRLFKTLADEIDCQYGELLLHSEVRWLSRGRVLKPSGERQGTSKNDLLYKSVHQKDLGTKQSMAILGFSLFFQKFPKTADEWYKIAIDCEEKWQFPHCLGAIDGKHVRIVPPKDSDSYYFNYKKTT
ncbi:unnamed protein product [Acanthoscelides obtectus]|uniref:DDE Tnp4 domain-containing protein n=1 Tax=Acanthoscelides obtectus TaxID=200917 RepID=A0A9P0JIM7_ACAOB|nr:unnamed protein product [Acanthoscelides obtectus]CAK1624894.1 SCAN domain-containing protein 3 [Acanthoscelides obtectus]